MTIQMKIDVLREPRIEFSNAKTDIDPRRGLPKNGPSDNTGLRQIKLGFVGLSEDIDAAVAWLSQFETFIPAKENNSSRFRNWPGLEKALNAKFIMEKRHRRVVSSSKYNQLSVRHKKARNSASLSSFSNMK